MYKLKLTYFDIPGRGEPARLAMHIGGIEFEDFRFPFDQFGEIKETTPLKQVPTLTVDGHQVTQSNGINRFVVRHPYQAARAWGRFEAESHAAKSF